MEIRNKLRVVLALSVLALVLQTVVFISPGWVVIKQDLLKPVSADRGHVHETSQREVSISFGIWFYRVCMCTSENSSSNGDKKANDDMPAEKHPKQEENHKCYHNTYKKRRHPQRIDYVGEEILIQVDEDFENGIPEEFLEARDFISMSVEFARHARHELAAYVTIGIILGCFGLIGAICYTREHGKEKHTGRLACSTQVLSSFFYWLAIVRAATYIFHLRAIRHFSLDEGQQHDLYFSMPWCLVVGAIGAIIMDVCFLFHLILISRDRKPAGAEYIFEKDKCVHNDVSIIIPNEVHYPSEEGAGSLPPKQSTP